MHMVFYVCYGRVQVDICGVQFSAGKGSVFQIPRGKLTPTIPITIHLLTLFISLLAGNYYSFQNSHDKNARLFFTQCCLPEGSEVPVQNENATQSEFEAESGPSEPPAAKPRGRPKGKQKAK
jgi:centromere protein C